LGYGLDDREFESQEEVGIFLFTTASIPVLKTTQPPIQWVIGAVSLGMKLITHLHLVPRTRMRGTIPLLHQYAFMAWCSVKAL
jgi:hypothetical protein